MFGPGHLNGAAFAEPHARFVVLWAPDGAGLVAARDAYLDHQAKVDSYHWRERRYYFTPVAGGEVFYGHRPREAAEVPVYQLVAMSGPESAYYWSEWAPAISWWPMHGRAFVAACPEVGWRP